jgi:hypothetical protein
LSTQAMWKELRMRLFSEVVVLQDCCRRMTDGISDLGPERPQLDYVERQLTILAERVRKAQNLVNDVKRDGPGYTLAVAKGGRS